MEAVCLFEPLVFKYQTIQCNNSKEYGESGDSII